jgi:benzaldehyde dehydrogenase (NAD)
MPGGAKTGQALIADPHVRVISFTGSSEAGRKVGEAAARLLKRVHLELGGNSALLILDDADLDLAAGAGAWGSFLHQGQICMTTGRHLVHQSVADDYVERLAAKASGLPVGNPATEQVALGPIIDAAQRDKVHGLVTSSADAGARVAAGGTYEELFYQPTVLTDVTPRMPAWAQEVFGPVAPIMRFSDPEEAVKLAADSSYGLVLGIITQNPLKGLELADHVHSGIVHINDQTVNDEAVAPFGGVSDSGTGARLGGPTANIEAFTETQWVTLRSEVPEYPF